MKVIIFIILFFHFHTAFSQADDLDSLIQMLNNNQIIDDGDWIGSKITTSGPSVSKLLEIGKPASNKLISVLADSSKGIIAHCILSWIWDKGGRPQSYYNNRERLEIIIYNDLCFFRKENEIYANKDDLERNKAFWKIYVQ